MDELDKAIREALMWRASRPRSADDSEARIVAPRPASAKRTTIAALFVGIAIGVLPMAWLVTMELRRPASITSASPASPTSPRLVTTVDLGDGGRSIAGTGTTAFASVYGAVYQFGDVGEKHELNVDSYADVTAVATSAQRVWMAGSTNATTAEVIALDSVTDAEVANVTFEHSTIDALAASDEVVWVALQTNSGAVLVALNAETSQEISRAPLGSAHAGILRSVTQLTASRSTAWALVSNIRDSGLSHDPSIVSQSVAEVSAGSSEPQTTTIDQASGIAISPDGTVLWIAMGHGGLAKLDTTTAELTQTAVDDAFGPIGSDSKGVWLLEVKSDSRVSLAKYDDARGSVSEFLQLPVEADTGKWPMASSWDPSSGRVWILNENGTVFVVST